MGKRTEAANAMRREEFERHALWAKQKEPAVGVLIGYTAGCHAYAPWPATPVIPDVPNYATVLRIVLVPPQTEVEIVIPAGYCQIVAGKDKKTERVVLVLRGQPGKDGKADAFYADVNPGLEIVTPIGKVAKLVRDAQGEWDVDEPDDAPIEAPAETPPEM